MRLISCRIKSWECVVVYAIKGKVFKNFGESWANERAGAEKEEKWKGGKLGRIKHKALHIS